MRVVSILFLSACLAVLSCSMVYGAPPNAPSPPEPGSPDNAHQAGPANSTEVATFENALRENFIGFDTIVLKPFDVATLPPPKLSSEEAAFYHKFAGIYVSKQLYDTKSIPLTNLVRVDATWGPDYFYLADSMMIDYSSRAKRFYFSIGDRTAYIADISNYKLQNGWRKISGPDSHLRYVNSYLAARNSELKALSLARIDRTTRDLLWEQSKKVLTAIRFLDGKSLQHYSSSRYGVSQGSVDVNAVQKQGIRNTVDAIAKANQRGDYAGLPDSARLLAQFSSDIGGRFLQERFHVYVDEFINTDPGTFEATYKNSHLIECVFDGTNEYISLGFVVEHGEPKLCFIDNGTSDL